MYKLSVPMSINVLPDEILEENVKILKESGVERVFLCGVDKITLANSPIYTEPERCKKLIDYYKNNGFEVGIWVNSIGHGYVLSHEDKDYIPPIYQDIVSIRDESLEWVSCPLDENFISDFTKGIKTIAEFNPDIIMLDDDFRLNSRDYYIGCFCPLHLKELYNELGEEIPKDKLEKLIFNGGKNKYRDAYMKISGKSLLQFAEKVEKTAHSVNKNIRVGACTVLDNWDFCGTTPVEIAKAFAGNTEPFIRTIGAPYWSEKVAAVIEDTRLEVAWCKNSGCEIFAEGDVYPRPRYNVPSSCLEIFDMALICDGSFDGILKYMFDYSFKFGYETGYYDRHIKNSDLRKSLKEIFKDKKPVGIYAFNAQNKFENWDIPDYAPEKAGTFIISSYKSPAVKLLSFNTIPTSYENTSYPVLVFGENAKYIDKELLKNGAMLDATAAKILSDTGIDTGIISISQENYTKEYFVDDKDSVNFNNIMTYKISVDQKAKVISEFSIDGSPASYIYENKDGLRFFVLAFDHFFSNENNNYFNSYYRQSSTVKALEWVGKKSLPAVSFKNPYAYILTSKCESNDEMSVCLFNINKDDILNPEIILDKEYESIKFIGCNGELKGNKVVLSEVPPYGIAAFEVK